MSSSQQLPPEVPQPNAENPEELSKKLKVTEPKKWAAGVPAVLQAFQDILEETGPTRGMGALLKMNQKTRFRLLELCLARPG
jgi:hypothetical protein